MAKLPHTRAAMRVFYAFWQVAELAAGYRYTTHAQEYTTLPNTLRATALGFPAPSDWHRQLIEKIPNKWVKYLTTDLLTPCILVHECQGKSQEIGYLPLS